MEDSVIKNRVIGIDISVELTSYAIVDIRGHIIARDGFPTHDYANVNDYVSTLSERVVIVMPSDESDVSSPYSPGKL